MQLAWIILEGVEDDEFDWRLDLLDLRGLQEPFNSAHFTRNPDEELGDGGAPLSMGSYP